MNPAASKRLEGALRRQRILYGDALALEPPDEPLDRIGSRLAGLPPEFLDPPAHLQSSFIQKFLARYSAELKRMAEAKLVEAEVIECESGNPAVLLDLSTGIGVLDPAESASVRPAVGKRVWVAPLELSGHSTESAAARPVCSLALARGRRSLSRIESFWAGGIWVEGSPVESWPSEGWVVDIDGVNAALPAEETGETPLSRNAPARFFIVQYDPSTFCVVLSRKRYLDSVRRISEQGARNRVCPGDIVTGRIASVSSASAWVEINGVLAELPGEDAGFGPARENLSAFHPGQTITVMILDVLPEKISVGTRQLTPDPWVFIKKSLQPGARVEGQVRKISPDRVMVELSDGVMGEILWKEAGWQVLDPADLQTFFAPGGRIEAVCQAIQREQGKISLSVKAIRPDPLPDIQRRYSPGTRVDVRLVSCVPARALVLTDEGWYGEILPEDLSWSGPVSPVQYFSSAPSSSGLPPHRRLTAEALSVNPTSRLIRFGVKQLKPDPFVILVKEISAGKIYEGRVVKNIAVGTLVEIRKGLVGLLRKLDYAPAEPPPAEGQTIQVMVVNIQPQQRRILLSRQSVVEIEERRDIQPYLANPQDERKVRMKDVLQGDVFKKFFDKK